METLFFIMRRYVCLFFFWIPALLCGQTTYVFTVNSYSPLPITINVNGQDSILNRANKYAKPGAPDAITVILYGDNNSWIALDKDGDIMNQYDRIVVYKDGVKPEERNSGTIDYIRIILKAQTKVSQPEKNNQPVENAGNSKMSEIPPSNTLGDSTVEVYNNGSWKESVVDGIGDIATTYGDAVVRGMNISMEGFPYFSIHAGYNRFNDFSLGLKYRSKGFTGASIFANCGFMKKSYGLPWDVGFGICFQDFALDMRFGNTDLSPNYGLMVDATYDWYFMDNLGVSFIVGLGFGNVKKKDPDVIWNLGLSLSYKLWYR